MTRAVSAGWQLDQAKRLAHNPKFGIQRAAKFLKSRAWSIEAALFLLIGAEAVERHQMREYRRLRGRT